MNLSKKIISVAAAAALVAGAGAMAATPAQAKGKTSGTTTVTLKKDLPAAFFGILAILEPAKLRGTAVSFPVTGANGAVVTHSGGIGFKTLAGTQLDVTNPVLTVDVPAKTATISFSTPTLGEQVLFTARDFKIKSQKTNKKTKTTTVIWTGKVNLVNNPILVGVLSDATGVALTPGMDLGSITTRIVTKK